MKLKQTQAVINCKTISDALDKAKEVYFPVKNLKCQIKRFDWIGYPYLCGYVFIVPSKKAMDKIQNDFSNEITYSPYEKCFPNAEKIGFDLMHNYIFKAKKNNDLEFCLNLIDELVDLCLKHTQQGKSTKKEQKMEV